MPPVGLRITIIGLSITSSWGNGHATTYRGLVRELNRLGHRVLFLERDATWYADNRDLPQPGYCRLGLYQDLVELKDTYARDVRDADLVIVGSYVPQGVEVGKWVLKQARGVRAFYDIDTPVTLAKLARGHHEYISPELIARYDCYLSFTGGPTLARLETEYSSPRALPLYCSFDPDFYFQKDVPHTWDLGYIGTYSDDRQRSLDYLMLQEARRWPQGRFVVAGPQYPQTIDWPGNVQRIDHLPPDEHRDFYNSQRFTLNITRQDMIQAGYSPSARLFEAAACGTPIISDYWSGLETFFTLGSEILIANRGEDVAHYLQAFSEEQRKTIGRAAQARVMEAHTAAHRAMELDGYTRMLMESKTLV